MKTLAELIDEGWNISIHNEAKRMDGPEGRTFYLQIVWLATKDDKSHKSRWKGFNRADRAINNLLKTLNKL